MLLKNQPVKNFRLSFLLIFLFTLSFALQSCKKSHSDLGKILFKKTNNKVFKDIVPDSFAVIFQKELEIEKSKINNAAVIMSYYKSHGYDPVLIMEHLPNDDIKLIISTYKRANLHGLDPKMFQTAEIDTLLNKFYQKNSIKDLKEAYHNIAQLEILLANSLMNYSNDMQYGVVNPRRIYSRYFTATKRPDTASMNHVFNVVSFKTYLDSIQPKNPEYLALQKALADGYTIPGISKEETRRALIVNLERLRWKNKPTEERYIVVNIPDYRLNMVNNDTSELTMKVCVGEGRNKTYTKSLVAFVDSDKVDHPFIHETPQLNSVVNEAQVNPIWNIPQSIAAKEIIVGAQNDPNYLVSKNINVYKKGKLVEDTEDIQWDENSAKEYSFKQQPGDDNSLGKIKFLFPNNSSVYLHDTPAKEPFNWKMRAVSHGCVRLEKPLDLAKALFGEGSEQFQLIEKNMQEDNDKPTWVTLPKKMPVYITYITCWVDKNGQLQFRPDVYGLDIVLYAHLQKLIAA